MTSILGNDRKYYTHNELWEYYFLWRRHENMSPCTGSRVITSYERITCVLEPSFDRGLQSFKATPPPAIMPRVLTTRPWPVRQKCTGTISHTRWNNGLTLSRMLNSDFIVVGTPLLIQFNTLQKICKTCLMFIWNFYRCYMNLNYDCIETDGDY